MPFDAFDRNGQHIDISKGLDSSLDLNSDYYCCDCHCVLHIKAVDSNKRATHFAGKHEPWCDEEQISKSNERIYDYRFTSQSLEELLVIIQSEGVKKQMIAILMFYDLLQVR